MTPAALSTSTPRRRPWWIVGAAGAGLAALLALLEAGQLYVRQIVIDEPIPWWESVERTLPSWVTLMLLIPVIVPVAGRVRFDRSARVRTAATHLAVAALFVTTHAAMLTAYFAMLPGPNRPFWLVFGKLLTFLSITDVLIYSLIAGGQSAWHWYTELQARELATAQLQASLTEARLQALRGQLNPHFLFNTLNAISVLALKEESAQVVRTLNRLGDLLRASLSAQPRQEVRLAEELDFVDGYLEIQELRFADRLSVAREIEPGALDGLVPAMILQPLVENAVLHGVAPGRDPGRITIRARVEDGLLHLEVRDTGPGFPAGVARDGIGLANTRARLEQIFGETHVLECANPPGGGAAVRIRLPFRPAAEPARAW
jgi:two-component system, LytTR family, sensor kinase